MNISKCFCNSAFRFHRQLLNDYTNNAHPIKRSESKLRHVVKYSIQYLMLNRPEISHVIRKYNSVVELLN